MISSVLPTIPEIKSDEKLVKFGAARPWQILIKYIEPFANLWVLATRMIFNVSSEMFY